MNGSGTRKNSLFRLTYKRAPSILSASQSNVLSIIKNYHHQQFLIKSGKKDTETCENGINLNYMRRS